LGSDVELFSHRATGQTTAIDASLCLNRIARAAKRPRRSRTPPHHPPGTPPRSPLPSPIVRHHPRRRCPPPPPHPGRVGADLRPALRLARPTRLGLDLRHALPRTPRHRRLPARTLDGLPQRARVPDYAARVVAYVHQKHSPISLARQLALLRRAGWSALGACRLVTPRSELAPPATEPRNGASP